MGEGIAQIQGIRIPASLGPGEPFEMAISVKNIGLIDTIYVTIYEGETIIHEWIEEMNPGEMDTFALFFPEGVLTASTLTVKAGHTFVTCDQITDQIQCESAGCYWWSDNTCHSTPESGEQTLCQWLKDQVPGFPDVPISNIPLSSVFTLIDHYLFQTSPLGYDFIPMITGVFGTIDYYLGFDGDTSTGCDLSSPGGGGAVLYERYTTEESGELGIGGNNWGGQIFTVGNTGSNTDHELGSIKLKIRRGPLSTGDVTIGIRNIVSGLPYGEDIISLSVPCSLLPSTDEWYEFAFPPGLTLQKDFKYAIILRYPDGSKGASYFVQWRQANSGTYTGGELIGSPDAGVTWEKGSSADKMFEIYGYPI